MRTRLVLSILVLLLGTCTLNAEEGKPLITKALVVWAASDANKVHPISGNVLEEHYWHRQEEKGHPYFAAPSYQGPRSGTLREKSTIWDAASSRVSIRAAGNEFVSFQVIVERAEQPLKGIRVSVSDLAGPDGAMIRSDPNIETFAEHYIQVFSKAKDVWDAASYYGEKFWFPDGLIPTTAKGWDKVDLPDSRLNVDGQKVQGFWIDVYVPHKSKPGLYTGKVTVSAENMSPQELDLQLEVLPWDLPDEVSFLFELNTYGTGFAKAFEAGNEAGVARIEHAFHKMAHEHRCTLNIFPGKPTRRDRIPTKVVDPAYVPKIAGEGPDMHVVDWSAFDKRFETYFTGEAFQDCPRKGIPLTHFYLPFSLGWPSDFNNYYDNREKYEAEYKAILKAFDKHIAGKGWKKTQFQYFFNGKKQFGEPWNTDEPTRKDEYDALRYYGQLLIDAIGKRLDRASNIRYRVDIGTYRTTRDQLDGIIDLRVVNYEVTPEAFWDDLPSGMKATRAKLGDEWWHYAKDDVRQRHTRLDWAMMSPIIYGWSGWDLKTQGYCLWNCMDWNAEDPFNKPGPIWSYVAVWYPGHTLGIDGPIPSMRLKGFRRGLQDYEHLACLAKLNKGDPAQADAILSQYYKLANAAPGSIRVQAEGTYKMRYDVLDAIQAALSRTPTNKAANP
jgi:hypothetical protein